MRDCLWCGKSLPEGCRPDRIYCNNSCRMRRARFVRGLSHGERRMARGSVFGRSAQNGVSEAVSGANARPSQKRKMLELLRRAGIYRASARVYELTREGHNIRTETVRGQTARYFLDSVG